MSLALGEQRIEVISHGSTEVIERRVFKRVVKLFDSVAFSTDGAICESADDDPSVERSGCVEQN